MQQTPFHAYYTARLLDSLSDQDRFLPVFASSDIRVYPFQVAAASFTLRSPYQKGAILCDEAGMGKSHEAMLIMNQRWLEGQDRILLCIPNADLLSQWADLLERHYTVPYTVLTSRSQWEDTASAETPNAFDQIGIVVTTYDFAASHEAEAAAIHWDLAVFEEANALSGVYQEDNVQAKSLYRIAGSAFKLLLTGTPIEKNIMDLYGLIWFIDNTVLPDEREFLARYLRRPEHYPELAERVGKYCFRTLRSQAKGYAKVPERVLLTVEYTPSPAEQQVYDLLNAYISKPKKLAFPEMDVYDLSLRLLGLLSSSTAAISQTLRGVIKRLKKLAGAEDEIAELQAVLTVCTSIPVDTKAGLLLTVLEKGLSLMKKRGGNRKAVIFTESLETQKMLYPLLKERYQVSLYNGAADYSAIRQFKDNGEVLLSTDHGAKGFGLETAAFVINYDLLYNTLKMEQRIDRCHRIEQQNDVLSVAFINKGNFADVRKLELVSKRMLVTDGVFGVSDEVIGGFTDNITGAFEVIAQRIRTTSQVEADYQRILSARSEENRQLIASAEDILFTTFTKELADKIHLSPRYVDERSGELNNSLWSLAKWFFSRYNETHTDCFYEIDDDAQTVTATKYDKLPVLFYYWDGSRNKKYQSQKAYGMAKDFKPRYGRITLSSIIGRGILHELECADSGTLLLQGSIEPCAIGLYYVSILSGRTLVAEHTSLIGKTDGGVTIPDNRCRELLSLPALDFVESGHKSPHWLKSSKHFHPLDQLVPVDEMIAEQAQILSPIHAEEAEKMKLLTAGKKAAISKGIDSLADQIQTLESERSQITNDRLKILSLDKRINQLRRELMSKQESQFFEAMRLDLELEAQIKAFAEAEKLTARVTREFLLEVKGTRL